MRGFYLYRSNDRNSKEDISIIQDKLNVLLVDI